MHHLFKSIRHCLAPVINPFLEDRIGDDIQLFRRVRPVPQRRVYEIDVLESESVFPLLGRIPGSAICPKTFFAAIAMTGVGLGSQREIVEVNKIGLDLFEGEAHNLLQVIKIFLVGKTRDVPE
jgi:hypothetical protein